MNDPIVLMLVGAIVVSSALTAAATIGFFRWIRSKQRRSRIPSGVIEELNDYSERFQKIVDDMRDVTRRIESRRSRNSRILVSLREMNRLLQDLHAFFEDELNDGRCGSADSRPADLAETETAFPSVESVHSEGIEPAATDNPLAEKHDEAPPDLSKHGAGGPGDQSDCCSPEFTSPMEVEKFRRLPKITRREIDSIDWDELRRRIAGE